MLDRPDWRPALQFPLGVIPAGSGNALAHSLQHWQGDPPEPDLHLSMAVAAARGSLANLDLFLVRGPGPDTRLGFLSLGWGLITDVDLGSEPLRWLGSLRFTLYGLLKVAKHKRYRGTISYILADWPDRRTGHTMQVPIHPLDSSDSDWTTSSLEPASPLYGYPAPPPAPYQLGKYNYAQSWQELDQRLCTVSFATRTVDPAVERGGSAGRDHRPPRSSRSPGKTRSEGKAGEFYTQSATPTGIPPAAPPPVFPAGRTPTPPADPQLHPLTATPLYKDWVSETSDYLSVIILNLPFLDRTFYAAPDCRPDDGVLWLLIVRHNVTRTSLINFMLSIENGLHVDIPGVVS